MVIHFAPDIGIQLHFWRLYLPDVRCPLTSFDDRQKYGLPAPIDAVAELAKAITGLTVNGATLDERSGDLRLDLGEVSVEIFNFTGYEIWTVFLPGGDGKYSNYVWK